MCGLVAVFAGTIPRLLVPWWLCVGGHLIHRAAAMVGWIKWPQFVRHKYLLPVQYCRNNEKNTSRITGVDH